MSSRLRHLAKTRRMQRRRWMSRDIGRVPVAYVTMLPSGQVLNTSGRTIYRGEMVFLRGLVTTDIHGPTAGVGIIDTYIWSKK